MGAPLQRRAREIRAASVKKSPLVFDACDATEKFRLDGEANIHTRPEV
jgi:hypothetical protein